LPRRLRAWDDGPVTVGGQTLHRDGEVHLLGCPVRELERELARERDLLRELLLMQIGGGPPAQDTDGGPSLLALVADIERHNRDLAGTTDAIREHTLIDGIESVDLHYSLTREAGPKLARVAELYDALDELTRDDDHLLTLPPTQAMVRTRHWFFGELAAQLAGADPIPWPEYTS